MAAAKPAARTPLPVPARSSAKRKGRKGKEALPPHARPLPPLHKIPAPPTAIPDVPKRILESPPPEAPKRKRPAKVVRPPPQWKPPRDKKGRFKRQPPKDIRDYLLNQIEGYRGMYKFLDPNSPGAWWQRDKFDKPIADLKHILGNWHGPLSNNDQAMYDHLKRVEAKDGVAARERELAMLAAEMGVDLREMYTLFFSPKLFGLFL